MSFDQGQLKNPDICHILYDMWRPLPIENSVLVNLNVKDGARDVRVHYLTPVIIRASFFVSK